MAKKDRELMILTRVKSPPYENKTEILYQGAPISIADIPKQLGFIEESGKYFYSIYRIKRSENGCCISCEGYIYDGSLEKDAHSKAAQVQIPFTRNSKRGLLDFLASI